MYTFSQILNLKQGAIWDKLFLMPYTENILATTRTLHFKLVPWPRWHAVGLPWPAGVHVPGVHDVIRAAGVVADEEFAVEVVHGAGSHEGRGAGGAEGAAGAG